ncbi:hypothetical protein THMIRHAM_08850 [Thiomicrorhabdus immobilis]|uniref:Beta-ketoacyl synthase-like N-terminal domain-containing protein n=1 Tax=Thiomicrorhabdus immobilis TaxID=2791037 RepID=A0ABM7MCJ3_9GAMM|nr:beta-ketoacyl synthase chain length factor [Thiomicrorhabdus immobilis]BCN93100.1 hypothetical protein THMIRHAM_08850 [Thiomicrorhabdus immobilis]
MKAQILSIGLTAPGLVSFENFKSMMLQNRSPDTSEAIEKYSPSFLPPNERRRTTATIKLALKTAEEALSHFQQRYPQADSKLPVLFVSKDGDTLISARMCQEVGEEEPMISPTQFHNSVHNAPAGYWMIGQKNQSPASAISVGQFAIANGLLEATLQSQTYAKPVLLVIYDLPLDDLIPADASQNAALPFAFSMILDASDSNQESDYPALNLSFTQQAPRPTSSNNPYSGLPAAEAYPLLQSLVLFESNGENSEIHFPLNRNNFIKVALT